MSKPSLAKKKRRQKRLEFRKEEEIANKNLECLSKSMQMIKTKLKETDIEFAEADEIFENLKHKYMYDKFDIENCTNEEREEHECFARASEIVVTKTLGFMEKAFENTKE